MHHDHHHQEDKSETGERQLRVLERDGKTSFTRISQKKKHFFHTLLSHHGYGTAALCGWAVREEKHKHTECESMREREMFINGMKKVLYKHNTAHTHCIVAVGEKKSEEKLQRSTKWGRFFVMWGETCCALSLIHSHWKCFFYFSLSNHSPLIVCVCIFSDRRKVTLGESLYMHFS